MKTELKNIFGLQIQLSELILLMEKVFGSDPKFDFYAKPVRDKIGKTILIVEKLRKEMKEE